MTRPVVSLTAYRTEPARLLMLLRRAAADDRTAFTRLYDALVPEVSATVRALRADSRQADEITAAAFVEAWHCADQHTAAGTDVAAWINDLAVRHANEPAVPDGGRLPGIALAMLLERRSSHHRRARRG